MQPGVADGSGKMNSVDLSNRQIKCEGNANKCAIVAGCSTGYLKYLRVALKSILENGRQDFTYDFVLFISERCDEEETIIQEVEAYSNARARFFLFSDVMPNSDNYYYEHGSIESFYKMISPFFLEEYDKVVCLDVDLIFRRDIADLFEVSVTGDKVLAAVRDVDSIGLYNGGMPFKKEYYKVVLQIKEPEGYFQAGVVLYDLIQWRKLKLSITDVLDLCVREKWELMDQDVMNVLYEGKAQYLDYEWNVVTDCGGYRIKKYISRAPKHYRDLYMKSRENPYVVHYAGPEKPWNNRDMDMANDFWAVAKKCSHYEELSEACQVRMSEVVKENALLKVKTKILDTIYIMLVKLHILKRYSK